MDFLVSHLFAFSLGVAVCNTSLPSFLSPKTPSKWISALLEALCSFLTPTSSKLRVLESVKVELLDKYQVEEKYDGETWQRQGYDAFAAKLTDKSNVFPCIYGTKGLRGNDLDFLFLESEELASEPVSKAVARGLLEYHKRVRGRGPHASLVIMTPPPTVDRSIEQYHKLFWSLLHRLRRLDPSPWPQDVPEDTDAPHWCFNFDATSTFISVLAPAYYQRRSRYAPNMCIIYQPRHIFDRLFITEKSRNSATSTIRALVDKHDLIPHSPDMSNYGVPGATESRQYFTLDQNVTAVCPYKSLEEEIV